ncbi:HTH-type transcriptional repressor CsiR [Roseovarius gaetbuli]|uniref:HTH-type transcriptional repressor CsiR n=1 Tax=Roseovarius gaetbuli TaxID=1356575 RepID=A0A1X6YGP7_9RHOB|nr:GntR family transcriptional regulator [Roseovarius gaetbuli]SLN20639.1 HTH-type transcriptional repressor CsiR [Roseovarius gaetbuli]
MYSDPEKAPAMSELKPEPIGRTALAVEITNRLRQMILEGQLEPGGKINEKLLTEQFGVSRTPLREALKVLASEGLLDLIPHRGAVITRQSEAELAEVFRVLAALEGLAGELAAVAASDGDLKAIEAMTQELRRSYEETDRPTYFRINQAIHKSILAAADNETLLRSHELLAYRVQRARYQANLTPDRWRAAVEEHEAIAEALCAREAAKTAERMKDHLLKKLASISAKA